MICKMPPMALSARLAQCVTPAALRAYLAEFLSTFFYVFAVVGSAMSSRELMGDAVSDPASLVIVALANTCSLSAAVYMAWNVSGGHVNPAVTFGMAVGGHISVSTALFYWISQMLASIMACLLLRFTTVGQGIPSYAIAEEMTGFRASVVEGVVTFGLVYTVYVALQSGRSSCRNIGGEAVVIGLMAGANVLAVGPFSGGTMNPASAFGSVVVSGRFKNQAVYWVGPLFGAALTGLLHDNLLFPATQPSDSTADCVVRSNLLCKGGRTYVLMEDLA